MNLGQQRDLLRVDYARVLDDPDALWSFCRDDAVFRIAGSHPLSGCYEGRAAVETYLAKVRQVPGRSPGFTITTVLRDEAMGLLLVEGVARHGDPAFVRSIVHVLRLRDGLVAQMWDYPFDQRAEDRFWSAQFPGGGIPTQRLGSSTATLPATPTLARL